MIAGSDTGNGAASALTEISGSCGKPHHQRAPRRVGQRRERAVEG